MSRRVVALLLLAVAALASGDERGTERFRYECASQLGERDVTLFANGTVRLRQGPAGEPRMFLAELGPEELASRLELLGRQDATGEVPEQRGWAHVASGPWVERCLLVLTLENRPEERYELSQLDVLPLRIAQLVHAAEELARRTRPERSARQLPESYQPVRGHVVENAEGQRFRVEGFTGDLQGIELEGVDQPVTLYVSRENLRQFFFSVSESDGQ